MTRARQVMSVLAGSWLATAVVPAWFIGGLVLITVTASVLQVTPTPWAAGLLLVVFDLTWLAGSIGMVWLVVRSRRPPR